MKKRRLLAAATTAACMSSFLTVLPGAVAPSYAASVVSNNFEETYEGWHGTTDEFQIKAVNGAGFENSRGMAVTGRTTPADGAASSKGLWLEGGINYTYNLKVFAKTDETFHLTLLYKDLDTAEETTVELVNKEVKAGEWTDLSTSFKAPENTYEYLLTLTTDSTNDFWFDDVLITQKKKFGAAQAAPAGKGLKDEFASYFRVGNIFNRGTISNSTIQAIILKDHNAIECENETKPNDTIVANGSTDTNVKVSLNSCAAIADFAQKNGLGFRGHTFVWHSQTPEWFFKQGFNNNNGYVNSSTMDQRMESYIKNMFDAFKNQYPSLDLYAYDVCNEVIYDGTAGNGGLRPTNGTNGQNGSSAWVRVYGNNSFVEKAFTYARKYAPSTCKLYYNDYNEFAYDKQNCIINTILKPLKEKKLIDGMGMQSHLNCAASGAWGDTNSYLSAMDKYLNLGIDVQVTELDLSTEGGKYSDSQQSAKYAAIFKHAMDWNKSHPNGPNVTLVQVWGPNDNNSWVATDKNSGKPNSPLLYTGNNQPKSAYTAITNLVADSDWGIGKPYTGPGSGPYTPPEPKKPDSNGYYFHHTFEGTDNGWETRFSEKVSTSGRTSYEGSEALLVQGRTAGWNGAKFALDSNPFAAGEKFSFSANVCYLDGDEESETFMMKLEYTDADGKTQYDSIAEGTAPKGEWLQLANTSYTIPEGATSAYIYIESAGKEAEDATYPNFYVDDVYGAVAGTKISGAGQPKVRTLVLGDLTFDGKINVFDSILARRGLINGGFSDDLTMKAADVDQSGVFDAADVVLLQKFLLGRITKFPVAEKVIDTKMYEDIFKNVSTKISWKHDDENNPLTTQRFGADPGWLVYDGRLYIYTTNDAFEYKSDGRMQENTYNSGTINCVSSADMVNWTDHGAMPIADRNGRTSNGAAKWASAAWAPDACCKTFSDGTTKFYLFFANSGGGIGVVMGDSPTGPWTDPIGGALLSHSSPNCSDVEWMFDPGVYYDDKTDECYLFFGGGRKNGIPAATPGTGRVVKVNLEKNKVSLSGNPVKMDIPYLFEDSSVIKVDGTWYYSYCSNWDVGNKTVNGVNFGNADILYMKSTNPLEWNSSKLAGNVFKNTGSQRIDNGGNNHHSIMYFKNKYYVAYHSRQQAIRMVKTDGLKIYNNKNELTADGNYRSTQINEATFSNGSFSCSGNMAGCKQIEALDPYTKVQAETMSNQSRDVRVSGLRDTKVTGGKGDWIQVSGAALSKGVKKITINGSSSKNAAVKVCAGSPTGKVIGYVPLESTAKEVTVPAVNSVTGSNNIYFVFSDDVQIDYWSLS
ncbi:MAG: endo-1,4-beta-xylanase [Ruminococcus sp.]|nr:endo-1,4-beta-xylanase [Ruminococcus sp.]